MLEPIFITALLAALVMLLLNKWNYFEKVRVSLHIEPCMICHCFWICMIIASGFCIAESKSILIALLFAACATPVTYYISVR